MDSETNASGACGHLIPSETAGLDKGRTSYWPANVLQGLNLEEAALMGAARPGSTKSPKPGTGSPKPKTGSPKPGTGSPKPKTGSPKPKRSR
jgi:hypothetical protein